MPVRAHVVAEGRFMAVVQAYFDESVRSEGRGPICVGGFLFKAPDYERFAKRWRREVLRLPDKRQLRHLHMTDLCAGQGEYKSLLISDRVAVFDRAVDVLDSFVYGSVAVHFLQSEFERIAPADWPKYRGSIYSVACHVSVQAAAQALRKWGCHLDVSYVFEKGHRFQHEADDILTAVRDHTEARKDFKYRDHRFADKSEAGLQAADLLVWWITKVKASKELGMQAPRAVKPFLEGMRRLGAIKKERQLLHDLTGEKLYPFIRDQASLSSGLVVPVCFRPRRSTFR